MKIVQIKATDIILPKTASHAPEEVLEDMATEIQVFGWPKGKELDVIDIGDGQYQVSASYSWFRAGLKAKLTSVPCVIV